MIDMKDQWSKETQKIMWIATGLVLLLLFIFVLLDSYGVFLPQ